MAEQQAQASEQQALALEHQAQVAEQQAQAFEQQALVLEQQLVDGFGEIISRLLTIYNPPDPAAESPITAENINTYIQHHLSLSREIFMSVCCDEFKIDLEAAEAAGQRVPENSKELFQLITVGDIDGSGDDYMVHWEEGGRQDINRIPGESTNFWLKEGATDDEKRDQIKILIKTAMGNTHDDAYQYFQQFFDVLQAVDDEIYPEEVLSNMGGRGRPFKGNDPSQWSYFKNSIMGLKFWPYCTHMEVVAAALADNDARSRVVAALSAGLVESTVETIVRNEFTTGAAFADANGDGTAIPFRNEVGEEGLPTGRFRVGPAGEVDEGVLYWDELLLSKTVLQSATDAGINPERRDNEKIRTIYSTLATNVQVQARSAMETAVEESKEEHRRDREQTISFCARRCLIKEMLTVLTLARWTMGVLLNIILVRGRHGGREGGIRR